MTEAEESTEIVYEIGVPRYCGRHSGRRESAGPVEQLRGGVSGD